MKKYLIWQKMSLNGTYFAKMAAKSPDLLPVFAEFGRRPGFGLGNSNFQEVTRPANEIQLTAEIALGGGQRVMAQTQLDLVDARPALERQLGVGAAQVVGCDFQPAGSGVALDEITHPFGRQPVALDFPALVERQEQMPEIGRAS